MSKHEPSLSELEYVIRRNSSDETYVRQLLAYALSLEKAIYDKRRSA